VLACIRIARLSVAALGGAEARLLQQAGRGELGIAVKQAAQACVLCLSGGGRLQQRPRRVCMHRTVRATRQRRTVLRWHRQPRQQCSVQLAFTTTTAWPHLVIALAHLYRQARMHREDGTHTCLVPFRMRVPNSIGSSVRTGCKYRSSAKKTAAAACAPAAVCSAAGGTA
jgi:hypothetical protein